MRLGLTTVSLAEGGVLPTGVYVLTSRHPKLIPIIATGKTSATVLIVADTNIVISEMPDEVHVWVTDLESGEPAGGRAVAVLRYEWEANWARR